MMTRNLSLTLATLLSTGALAAGCTAEAGGPIDEGDGSATNPNPTDPNGGPVPLTAQGTFRVQSDFDLATNLPGTVGTVVNYFILATDDPTDPSKFIIDKLIEALPDGTIKNYAQSSAPFITGYINDRLLQVAPELLTRIVNIGDAFGQVAHHFGTIETLQIDASGHATKTVTGVHFKVDNVEMDFPFADYNLPNVKVDNVGVTLDNAGKLSIAQHTMGLSYGAVLRLALDQAIIPMIDPSASNLTDILQGAVDCSAVGQYVYDAIGFGSPSTFESACTAGLAAGAGALYHQLDGIDGSALQFGLTGVARGIDANADGKMDSITTGTWTGALSYAGTPTDLAGAKFHGSKM